MGPIVIFGALMTVGTNEGYKLMLIVPLFKTFKLIKGQSEEKSITEWDQMLTDIKNVMTFWLVAGAFQLLEYFMWWIVWMKIYTWVRLIVFVMLISGTDKLYDSYEKVSKIV